MASMDEQILKVTKEVVVKFIEAGRVSPAGFNDTFKNVYNTVKETVQGSDEAPEPEDETEA
jgi:predicted transcriptional regulator